jgi:hypothetical protein
MDTDIVVDDGWEPKSTGDLLARGFRLIKSWPPQTVRVSLSETEAFSRYPCLHRLRTTEQHTCRPCGGSRVHTICECTVLDRLCTVRASDAWDRRGPTKLRVLCCVSCEHRDESPSD